MTNNLGITVMVNQIFGRSEHNASAQAIIDSADKRISSIDLQDKELRIIFDDGSGLRFYDDGQSCCESRYMRSDADLPYYVGAKFLSAEIREAPNMAYEYVEHEVQFLVLITDRGNIDVANHNEHNGYYGGFTIRAAKIEKSEN